MDDQVREIASRMSDDLLEQGAEAVLRGGELQRGARESSWEKIAREADAWARAQVVAWAEYVQKLVRALEDDRQLDACALRSRMALGLGEVCAVLKRVRSESENGFWETVAESGGPEWREAFERACAPRRERRRVGGRRASPLRAPRRRGGRPARRARARDRARGGR